MTKNLFFEKIQKGIKNVEFHADVKSVKKFLKNAQKSQKLHKFDKMNTSEESAYLCHYSLSKSLCTPNFKIVVSYCSEGHRSKKQRKHRSIDASNKGCFVQGRMLPENAYGDAWSWHRTSIYVDGMTSRKPVRSSHLVFRKNLLKLRHTMHHT